MRLWERFQDGKAGEAFPRITDERSIERFPQRRAGMKILLITPPIRTWAWPNIAPLGQEYVAAAARMDGHHIAVLDLNAERGGPWHGTEVDLLSWACRRVQEAVLEVRPDVVGVGAIITQYGVVKALLQAARTAWPTAQYVLGGGIASCLPAFMAERLPVDVVVQEEGEVTVSEVLHRLEEGSPLEGCRGTVARLPGGQILDNGLRPSVKTREEGLDRLPWPLRVPWPEDQVYKRNPVGHLNWQSKWTGGAPMAETPFSASMIASRGCPYAARACDFCYAAYLGTQYRLRSPAEVVDEMAWLKERYGVRYIHFLDDLLLTDYRWALAFAEEIISRKLTVPWGGTCRTNIVADDVLRARREGRQSFLERCHEAGMRQAGYGIESGSPAILKAIDKSGQTVEKMELAIAETKRILGYADCSFMIGSPGETEATVKETVDFCKRVGLQPEVFFFTTAYPGTTFWQLALDKGLIRKAVDGVRGPAADDVIEEYFLRLGEQGEQVRTNFSDLPDDEIEGLARWAVSELNPAGSRIREPHSGDARAVGAAQATL